MKKKINRIRINRIISTAVLMAMLLTSTSAMSGCSQSDSDASDNDVITLHIANCEEYIDIGGWDQDEQIELENGDVIFGENSIMDDFEDWYKDTYGRKVKVEYSTYGTNEELYNQMSLGNTFDLVCPSEYMIMKLMSEGRLQKLSDDFKQKSSEADEKTAYNYYTDDVSPYIESRLKSLTMNGEKVSDYAAGYMWGTLGIVYNPELVSEEDVSTWNVMLNKKYYKRVTMKDSIRDSYFAALGIVNKDRLDELNAQAASADDTDSLTAYSDELFTLMNDTSQETVDKAEDVLTDMRQNSYSLETDSGKADLVTGKVAANMQWSGDAVFSMDQAEEDGVELNYSVPDEVSNLWFDGWVMMKNGINGDADKQQAAEAFMNFVSRPDNAIRDMYYIGYTSCISGGDDDSIYDYLVYTYGADDTEDADDTAEYDVSYFFGRDAVFTTSRDQLKRQLFAQYPPEDVLKRCVIMQCFDNDANARISQMWTDVRCFRFPWES